MIAPVCSSNVHRIRKTSGRLLGTIVSALLGVAAAPAEAQELIILNTVANGALASGLLPVATNRYAVAFTTPNGASATALTKIVVGCSAGFSTAEVTLCTDLGGNPGTPLVTVGGLAGGFSPSLQTYAMTPTTTLEPNRVYWLVFNRPGNGAGYSWHLAANPSATPAVRVLAPGLPWIPVLNGSVPAIRVIVEPPASACCNLVTGACTLMPAATCAALGLTAQSGGVCTSAVCAPRGACCRGGVCTLVSQVNCVQVSPAGAWLGANSVCSPTGVGRGFNACCPADFDGSGTASINDIFAFVTEWFAGCP